MNVYRWREIRNVPGDGGVYAWYFTPEITNYDIEKVIGEVNIHKAVGNEEAASSALSVFLSERIFKYFSEQPYEAVLSGPLKPRYEGTLQHRPTLSSTLVERLVNTPERLRTVKQILETTVPNFSSPIYIGMSKNLSVRLAKHKSLIEKYLETPGLIVRMEDLIEEDQRDHSFARDICARGIPPTRLSVTVQVISGTANEWVDVENILNRIHFPLLGRN